MPLRPRSKTWPEDDAYLDHVHDTTDHAAVIDAGLAPYILGQIRLDLLPLLVAQPK